MSEELENRARSGSPFTVEDPDFDMLVNGQTVSLPRSKFLRRSMWVTELLEEGRTPWMNWPDQQNCDAYLDCVSGNPHAVKYLANAFDNSHGQADESEARGNAAETTFDRLIDLFSLANWKMHDRMTANLVLDEIIRFGRFVTEIPVEPAITQAFNASVYDDTIQLLLRDYWVHEILVEGSGRFLQTVQQPDLIREVAIEMLKFPHPHPGGPGLDRAVENDRHANEDPVEMLKHFGPHPEAPAIARAVERNHSDNPCYYHEHDDDEFPKSLCGLADPFVDPDAS